MPAVEESGTLFAAGSQLIYWLYDNIIYVVGLVRLIDCVLMTHKLHVCGDTSWWTGHALILGHWGTRLP